MAGLVVLGLFLILAIILLLNQHESRLPDNLVLSGNQTSLDVKEPLAEIEQSPAIPEKRFFGLPIAVVMDNLKESLPVSGINQALIVYEVPVEADITRFLAIFDRDFLPDKIGPVRSIRPYLTDWAEEYGSLFVHAGGSQEALKKIKQGGYSLAYNLDEISRDGIYFWRDSRRQAPHNLYILKKFILGVIDNKNLPDEPKSDFQDWGFKAEESSGDQSAVSEEETGLIIKINYRQPVIWQFDKVTGNYLRFQGDQPFLDEKGEQIGVENLVVQKTEINVLDEAGRLSIKTAGSGSALIFQNGRLIKGRWEKISQGTRTEFFNDAGQKESFLPGKIWVEIVSKNHEILY